MNDVKKQWDGTVYPEMIRNMPEVNVPIDGIRGWLLQDGSRQAVFFDIQPTAKVPPHTHCAQWGLMVDGEMALTIGDQTKVYRKGDSYFIPEGTVHSAKFITRVNVIDVFDAADRYKVKK